MPIRFRCVYCDKLLGIARRKAGAVVNCPQCNQPLIVPTPEPEPEPQPSGAAAGGPPALPQKPGKLFERDDFDAMLRGEATLRTPDEPRKKRRTKTPHPPAPPPTPWPSEAVPSLPKTAPPDPTTIPRPASPATGGIVLTPVKLIVLLIGLIGLLGLAFGGGILIGRMLVTG